MNEVQSVWLGWVVLAPLLSAVLVGLVALSPLRSNKGLASFLALAGPGASMLLAAKLLAEAVPRFLSGDATPVSFYITHWVILAGEVRVDARLLLDPLSAVMVSFVTGIGFLIHLYSVGYMHHEEGAGYPRYFSYLNLFMFSMLTLVLGDSLPLLFVGWEGVGLCSYLLIGYYFDKDFAHEAGKKAFVVNRIGDFGFLLGAFFLWDAYGTFDVRGLVSQMLANPEPMMKTVDLGFVSMTAGTAAGLLLFLGACGKSAQIPLYVWLPDAMAGPTPVSALIHAATMVTAGIYMLVRMNVLFRLAPDAMLVVAVIGALTAFVAATIALVQNDIKKVLAYSTVSQLGYMFLGCGAGVFVWGLFHVFTHAFFKACLFLGSGSVIHAMGGEQDIQKMGGLRKHLPITWWTFAISTAAIAGVPFLAGFFSKDAILAGTWDAGHPVLFAMAIATAAMTAFYMSRLLFRTFTGEFRGTHEQEHHLHESPWTMTLPLVVLAAGAAGAGYLKGTFEKLLAPIFPELPHAAAHGAGHHGAGHNIALVSSVVAAFAGIGLAVAWYVGKRAGETPAKLAVAWPGAYRTLFEKYFVDEFYGKTVVASVVGGARILWKWIDTLVIDGLVNAAAFIVELVGDLARFLTTGRLRDYAFLIALGTLVLAAWTLGI